MKALINADGKVLVSNGKVATDECDPGCCGPPCGDPAACNYSGVFGVDYSNCIYVNLVCDTVQVSSSKCGYSTYHKFQCTAPFADLGYGTEFTFSGCSGEFEGCAASVSGDSDPAKIYQTQTVTFNGKSQDGSCTTNCDTCGTATVTGTYDLSTCTIDFAFDSALTCCDPCFGCESPTPPCELGCPPFLSHPVTGGGVLTDEVTTALLIANAETALPDYDNNFGDACSASRDLSEDETSISIQKTRPKFYIDAPVSRLLIINYKERFIPDVGDTVDTDRSVSISAGNTETTGAEIPVPFTNGETTIVDITCALG